MVCLETCGSWTSSWVTTTSAWRSSLKTTKRLGMDWTKTGLGLEIPRTRRDHNRGLVFGPSPTQNFEDWQRLVLTGLQGLTGVGYIHNSICILTNQSWFGLCINSTITTTTPPPPFNPSPSLPHVQMWDGGPPPCFPLAVRCDGGVSTTHQPSLTSKSETEGSGTHSHTPLSCFDAMGVFQPPTNPSLMSKSETEGSGTHPHTLSCVSTRWGCFNHLPTPSSRRKARRGALVPHPHPQDPSHVLRRWGCLTTLQPTLTSKSETGGSGTHCHTPLLRFDTMEVFWLSPSPLVLKRKMGDLVPTPTPPSCILTWRGCFDHPPNPRVLISPPRNPVGLRRTPADSSGLQWTGCLAKSVAEPPKPLDW